MKKILITLALFLSLLTLSSCGSDGGINLPGDTIGFYSSQDQLYVAYPETWNPIDLESSENLVVGYFNPSPSEDGYFSNMTILKGDATYALTSEAYARNSVEQIRTRLLGYKQESYERFEYIDGEEMKSTYMHIFTGRDNFQSPEFKYIQTYYVKGDLYYTTTLTVPKDIGERIDEYIVLAKFPGFTPQDPFQDPDTE